MRPKLSRLNLSFGVLNCFLSRVCYNLIYAWLWSYWCCSYSNRNNHKGRFQPCTVSTTKAQTLSALWKGCITLSLVFGTILDIVSSCHYWSLKSLMRSLFCGMWFHCRRCLCSCKTLHATSLFGKASTNSLGAGLQICSARRRKIWRAKEECTSHSHFYEILIAPSESSLMDRLWLGRLKRIQLKCRICLAVILLKALYL